MATYFWVGGAGTWDNTTNTNWRTTSGGTTVGGPPTSADTATFDANSGTGAVTVTSTATCAVANLNKSGITLTLNANNTTGFVGGNFTVSGCAFSTSTFNFTTGAISVSGGSFTANGGTITASSLSSSGGVTKSITLNASTLALAGTSPISFTGSNFTFSAGTSTINCSNAGPTFAGGGYTFYNVSFTSTVITTVTLSNAFTANNLTFAAKGGVTTRSFVSVGANIIVNGTLSVNSGNVTAARRYQIASSTYGTSRTITAAAVTLVDTDFRDIAGAGAATWSGTRLGDAQGNSGITFAAPTSWYWNAAAGSWSNNSWATTSTGTPAATNFPLPQDTAYFTDNNPASGTITVNLGYDLPAIDFTARTLALTFSTSGLTGGAIYGSIALSSAITPSSTVGIVFRNRSNNATITSAGRTWTQQFTFSNTGSTVYFGDAFTSSATLTHSFGTLDAQTYNVTATGFDSSNSNTRTLNLGSGTWTLTASSTAWFLLTTTGLTFNSGTSTISLTSASAKNFSGGGLTYYNLNQGGAGALTVLGSNTFNNITNSVQPTTVTFGFATTQTFSSFSLTGVSGSLVTINSSSAGTQANLSKASGIVSCDYLSIQDSNATGGAVWNAGANSTNVSNNLGWIFTAPPITANGNFFLLFG